MLHGNRGISLVMLIETRNLNNTEFGRALCLPLSLSPILVLLLAKFSHTTIPMNVHVVTHPTSLTTDILSSFVMQNDIS